MPERRARRMIRDRSPPWDSVDVPDPHPLAVEGRLGVAAGPLPPVPVPPLEAGRQRPSAHRDADRDQCDRDRSPAPGCRRGCGRHHAHRNTVPATGLRWRSEPNPRRRLPVPAPSMPTASARCQPLDESSAQDSLHFRPRPGLRRRGRPRRTLRRPRSGFAGVPLRARPLLLQLRLARPGGPDERPPARASICSSFASRFSAILIEAASIRRPSSETAPLPSAAASFIAAMIRWVRSTIALVGGEDLVRERHLRGVDRPLALVTETAARRAAAR